MDPSREIHGLYAKKKTLKRAAQHYGLTLDEMGLALHYARIAKVMKDAADRQARRDLAEQLKRAAAAVSQRPETSFYSAPPALNWCLQCERRVSASEAAACRNSWCKARAAA